MVGASQHKLSRISMLSWSRCGMPQTWFTSMCGGDAWRMWMQQDIDAELVEMSTGGTCMLKVANLLYKPDP